MILERRCPFCHGQGMVPDPNGILSPKMPCPVCRGRGHNLVPRDAQNCTYCKGKGNIKNGEGHIQVCPDCGGIGYRW